MGNGKILKRIAVTQPNLNVYSETFIRNHIRLLGRDAKVFDLAGGWVPTHADGKPLLPKWAVFLEKAAAKLLGRAFIHAWAAQRVKAFLKREQVEFVLCEYGPGGVAMAPICQSLNLPFAVHFFGLDLHGKKLVDTYGEAYRRMFHEASLIIAISTLQRRILIEMGCPPEKIKHIVCGADTVYDAGDNIPAHKPPVFIAVGRMVEKKAPLTTLAAFAEVCKTFPQARLKYVGDGPLKSRCETFVRENALVDKVEFLGAAKPEFIATMLREALCFVQHSVTAADGDSEGTPVAILDAGLSGIPVVSTRHAGIMDTVIEGETGFLVDEHDMEGMAEAMKKLVGEPDLAHRMGLRAQAHIRERFTVEVTVGQLRVALNEAFAGAQ